MEIQRLRKTLDSLDEVRISQNKIIAKERQELSNWHSALPEPFRSDSSRGAELYVTIFNNGQIKVDNTNKELGTTISTLRSELEKGYGSHYVVLIRNIGDAVERSVNLNVDAIEENRVALGNWVSAIGQKPGNNNGQQNVKDRKSGASQKEIAEQVSYVT